MPSTKIILAEESYFLMGLLFKVYNEMGPIGFEEKHFQRAVELKLRKRNIFFASQVKISVPYEGGDIGKFYADIIVDRDDKRILLELKKSSYITLKDIKQTHRYLKAAGIKLGIIANFGHRQKLQYKRIINLN